MLTITTETIRSKAALPTSFPRTGAIWRKPYRARQRAVEKVCKNLEKAYGKPRLGNPLDPLDDLIFIVLSNKTGPYTSRNVYEQLRKRFSSWENIISSPISELRKLLKPAGLSSVKSRQLRAAVRLIRGRLGTCDLQALRGRPEKEIESFLTSLPGVSEKVAKCVMMYTLDARVMPVDVHVHRIARRLGWTARKRADQCHDELESLVPRSSRYTFHVDCVLHGRQVCRPHEPICRNCCIKRFCQYFKRAKQDV